MIEPVLIDCETQSAADLRSIGGRKYASHTSTKLLCCGFRYGERRWSYVPEEIAVTLPRFCDDGVEIHREIPVELRDLCHTHGVCGHNATSFDRYIWDRFIGIPVTWTDTIHMARQAGLPAALDDLGLWLTGRGKDPAKSLLLKVSRLEWDGKSWSNRWTLPGPVTAIVRYCNRDVDLLHTVWHYLRDFPFHDPGAIELDERINSRGIAFDEDLAAKIAEISTRIISDSVAEIHRIAPELKETSLRSIPKMREWLEARGVRLKNLRRETVERFIESPDDYMRDLEDEYAPDGLNPDDTVLKVLRLRNASLRITGAKLDRASSVCEGGRLHDLLVYHAAHTGRFSSRIVQVHNLPRGVGGLDTDALCDNLSYETVTAAAKEHEVSPDDILSSLIRPCFIAKPGHVLAPVDYSSIETRVVAWIAGDEPFLTGFTNDPDFDPYKQMASTLFSVPYDQVEKWQRQAAKPLVLGGVYGLGPKRLGDYAKALGVDLSRTGFTSEQMINKFRDAHPAIAGMYDGEYEGKVKRVGGLWKDLVQSFKNCVLYDVPSVVGKCRFRKHGNSVLLTLPSGRPLCYRKAGLEETEAPWGGTTISPFYVGGRGKCWLTGGTMTENIVQAIARDVLVYHMQIIDRKYPVVLHVHDEPVMEIPEIGASSALSECIHIMKSPPAWAGGLPLGAEGHFARRYTKG